jgi:2-polyprenyl-6-methoxyphenol hydroxylase-like FAD-dependent oxidoreductase
MKIGILGAGPAGLSFAYLMKRQNPAHEIFIIEQNPRGATWGFGVVFSGTALNHVEGADPDIFAKLMARAECWDDITIGLGDEQVPIDGNRFAAIGRLDLLLDLIELCESAGVDISFDQRCDTLDQFGNCDLIVGADGVNSVLRTAHEDKFGTKINTLTNAFAWYGTTKLFDTLTLTFRKVAQGAFVAHHYRYSKSMSTFLVECDADTFDRNGFADMGDEASRELCEQIFAHDLDGHALISNNTSWRKFPAITNKHWTYKNMIILGDAAHTAHFSIGSGTRLAMEDAAILSQAFQTIGDDVEQAFVEFERIRRPQVDTILNAAAGSYNWYEDFAGKLNLPAHELAYDYMTRSGRVDDDRLRKIAPKFMAAYDQHIDGK